MASTLGIRDKDFLAGKYVFTRDEAATRAEVMNAGVIRARDGGYVVLAGDYAANRGVVEAKLGTVLLGSANKMTLDIQGDSLVSYAMNERNLTELAGVANSGQLLADGGRVVMTAMTARSLTGAAVNNTGVIQARGVEEKGGAVYLLADDAGIALGNGSKIDVSGAKGGGTVLVGGNWQGGGSEVHASRVGVAAGATIKADATGKGDGGKVVLWSDGATDFRGSISARGGASGGDGGRVEVSGKKHLTYAGKVNTLAPKGRTGELLLDPADITISAAADDHITGGTPFENSDNTGSSILSVATLQAALGSSNVRVSTGAGSGGSGTITVTDAVTWNSSFSLSLIANNKININAAITGTHGSSTLALFAGSNQGVSQGAAGAINVNKLVLAGDGNYNLTNAGNSINVLTTNNTAGLGGTINQINGNLSLVNTGGLVLETTKVTGTTKLDVGGAVTQTGALTTAGLGVVSSGGAVTLANTNNTLGTLAVDANGAVNVYSKGVLTVGDVAGVSGVDSTGNDIRLQNNSSMALNRAVNAGAANLTLQSAGALTQSAALTAGGLKLAGTGSTTLTNGGNDVDVLASSRTSGTMSLRTNGALEIGSVAGTDGVSTSSQVTLNVAGALTQSQKLVAGGLEIVSSSGVVTLNNANNSFTGLAMDVHGDVDLRNKSSTLYTRKVGATTGVTTHNNDFTLVNTNTLSLGNGSTSGVINAGSGVVDLTSRRIVQSSNSALTADKLALTTTNYVGLSGTANNVNTLAIEASGAGGGSLNQAFDFVNSKSLTVGTVNGIVGIETANAHGKIEARGNITLADNINVGTGHLGLFAKNGGSYYTVDTGAQTVTAGALAVAGNDLKLDRNSNGLNNANGNIKTKVIAIRSGGDFAYRTPNELTISSNVWGLAGLEARHVYINTGKFAGYDRKKPASDFYDSSTGLYKAGLVLDGGITASGSVYLYSSRVSSSGPRITETHHQVVMALHASRPTSSWSVARGSSACSIPRMMFRCSPAMCWAASCLPPRRR